MESEKENSRMSMKGLGKSSVKSILKKSSKKSLFSVANKDWWVIGWLMIVTLFLFFIFLAYLNIDYVLSYLRRTIKSSKKNKIRNAKDRYRKIEVV